jgi:mannose-6-phosphate isomerase-like protein (cupin superfamily)
MKFHVSIEEAITQLKKEEHNRFTALIKQGSMTIEYYAPKYIDQQNSHSRDEIYVIATGNATFFRNGERVQCKTGDVLVVPAQMVHRFEKFSDDFATWVIFMAKKAVKHHRYCVSKSFNSIIPSPAGFSIAVKLCNDEV